MEVLNVLVAALGAFAFGAVWYMSMAKPWMAAAGIAVGPDGKPINAADKTPFVIGLIGMVLVAGMMRHIFNMAAIDTVGEGFVAGLGIGAFITCPWLAMNYAFAMRPRALTLIDGVNAIVGCAIIGAILALF
jgi:Protein of unknown function (DUF1761)